MSEKANIVLIGLSAYGSLYAKALIEQENEKIATLCAVIDPYAEKNPYFATIKALNIPCYDSIREYLNAARKDVADLAIIASPIHLHVPQTCEALKAGMNVLCEKPISGTVQDALKIIEVRKKAKKFVVIGYNWSFFSEILKIKQDFLGGKFGKPLRMKSFVLGPRSLLYYSRNNWAGKIRSDKGEFILDSPVNNAHSHYLHNMLFITGDKWSSSAKPEAIRAELYRANEIENYDTAVIEGILTNGARLLFVTSHAVQDWHKIRIEFEFEKGKLIGDGTDFKMYWNDGSVYSYGTMSDAQQLNKLWQCIDAVQGNVPVPHCGVEAALSQTICMNAAQESPAKIINFPKPYVKVNEVVSQNKPPEKFVYVEGLSDVLVKCYEQWKMPSDLGCEWAIPSKWIRCVNYKKFPITGHFAK